MYAMGPRAGDWGGRYCRPCAERLNFQITDVLTPEKPGGGDNMLITIEAAQQLERERKRAEQLANDAATRRNEAVLLLLEGGTSQREVASALGLSNARVSQIAAQARRQRDEGVPAAA